MKILIAKILRSIGLPFCDKCGSKMEVYREHVFYEYVDYWCPKCGI